MSFLEERSLGIECELMDPLTCEVPSSKQAFSKARYKIYHIGLKRPNSDMISSELGNRIEEPSAAISL